MHELLLKNLQLHDINPRVCGMETCAPGHAYGPAIREYWLLHYVVRGCGIFRHGAETCCLRPGEIFVIRPGDVTYYEADAQTPWEYIWVGFDCGESFASLLQKPVLQVPGALELFMGILGCGGQPSQEWLIFGKLYALFAKLAAMNDNSKAPIEDSVSQAINYMESNYARPLQIGQIAAELGLSRGCFCRIFKARTGFSPREYLISYRLSKAAEFLTEYGLPQKEAAQLAGYPDVYSFSRMFRRKYGVPPGIYVLNEQRKAEKRLSDVRQRDPLENNTHKGGSH